MPGNQNNTTNWDLLRTGTEQDFYASYLACYDDLYRLGLYLYKEPELVREGIHLLYIELWNMRDRFGEVLRIREYVLTIFKRVLYKQKTSSVKHWSRIEAIDSGETNEDFYTASYAEMLINNQESDILRNKLKAVLPLLGERQQELIRMRYFEERSIDEIAQITGLATRTIYNTMHNALSRLKELLR